MAASRSSPSSDGLLVRVEAFLARHTRPGGRIAVALSGGVDSMVLLELLHRVAPSRGLELSACHVHHGLSRNADAWADFCAAQCLLRGMPMRIARVDVAPGSGLGLEGAARRERHAVFARLDVDWLALAHHRGDQAETVLHRLLRGGGARGLAGMAAVRGTANPVPCAGSAPTLLRPLLDATRSEIEAWARASDLPWIEDESNQDTRHTRNFLRQDLLPLVATRFPEAEATLARAARQFGEVDSMLGALAGIDLAAARRINPWGDAYDVATLAALGDPRAINALRHALTRHAASPPRAELDEVWRQLGEAGLGANIHAGFGAAEVHGWRGMAWVGRISLATLPARLPWPMAGQQPALQLAWGDGHVGLQPNVGAGVRQAVFARTDLWLGLRQGGERLRFSTSQPRRTLKNLFQEHAVPPWLRQQLPLLFAGEDLVGIPGIGVDFAYRAAAGEPGFTLEWVAARPVGTGRRDDGAGCPIGF